MTIVTVPGKSETFSYDTETGKGQVVWRAETPPWDAHLKALDDHFLGARLLGPLKPWLDPGGSTEQHASPGSVHAIVAECAAPWASVADSLLHNAQVSLARPINFPQVGQVCMGGGLPPCATSIPTFEWDPMHDYRPLRHLMAWRRFGWPSDLFLAQCAVARVIAEPSLYDGKQNNQRYYGWDGRLLAECLGVPQFDTAEVRGAIQKLIDLLWAKHGPNYITLNTAAGADHDHLPVCSWQHCLLADFFELLIRRGWADPRVLELYKAAMKGLDAMRQPGTFSWVKDWDPATGATMPAETVYSGTSLWTACAYARSLDVLGVGGMAKDRAAYVQEFAMHSAALDPKDKNYDAAADALIVCQLVKAA
jgi:hypothetical protein